MLRRAVCACIVACVVNQGAQAQDWARKMFEAVDHDFGTVARGSKIDYRFRFTNSYEEDVHVSGVRSSCGCTTPEVSTKTLKSWETGEVIATFNTRDFLGQRSATLTVTLDKPYFAEVQLHIKGYVRSDVVLDPSAAEFGSVAEKKTHEKLITVAYAGRRDWKILDVKSPDPNIAAEARELSRDGSETRYEIAVRLSEGMPGGYFRRYLTLVTNDSNAPELPLEVSGRIGGEVTVNPSPLIFGVLEPGQTVTKKLVIRAGAPFKVISIESNLTGVRCDVPSDAKAVHVLSMVFEAGQSVGSVSGKLKLVTEPALAIPEITAIAEVATATAAQP